MNSLCSTVDPILIIGRTIPLRFISLSVSLLYSHPHYTMAPFVCLTGMHIEQRVK